MSRIEKIRQMTDEELADVLLALDNEQLRGFCTGACIDESENLDEITQDHCRACMVRWLREEGPLMDGEGA